MADGARVAPAKEGPAHQAQAEQHEQRHHTATHAAAAAAGRQGERLVGREARREFEARWRAGAGAHGGTIRAARMVLHVGGRRNGGLWGCCGWLWGGGEGLCWAVMGCEGL